MRRPRWMTDARIAEAREFQARGVTVRDMAAEMGLTYHRALKLRNLPEQARDTTGWEMTVVFGDAHVPFHDPVALGLVYQFIEDTQPDRVVINGDFLDCYKISHFSKDPLRGDSFAAELATGRDLLYRLRDLAPDAEIVYICGNHEHRLHRYIIDNAGELRGLEGLTIQEQLHLDKLGIDWVACNADKFIDTSIRMGELLIGHFDLAHMHSGYTAKALLDKYGLSVIQGHVHSMGVSNKTLADGPIMAWEGGCLCNLAPHYCRPAKWVHGFAVVNRELDGSFFHVQPVLILDGRFFFGGRLWTHKGETECDD
jgi:hypothetical protein